MDYSLLMFIVIKPFSHIKTRSQIAREQEVDFSVTIEEDEAENRPSDAEIKLFNRDEEGPRKMNFEIGQKESIVRQMSDELFENERPSHPLESSREDDSALPDKSITSDKSDRSLYLSEMKIIDRASGIHPRASEPIRVAEKNDHVYLMKEPKKRNVDVYIVSDEGDIAKMKHLEQEENQRASLNTPSGGQNSGFTDMEQDYP